MEKLKEVIEKLGVWCLSIMLTIIVFGGAFAAALWIIKCIIKLLGGM